MNEYTDLRILQRLPSTKLSYETISHKKISPDTHPIGIIIPQAKKCFAWFTYDAGGDICLLLDINRDIKISAVSKMDIEFNHKLSLGTILYGSYIENASSLKDGVFLIEDILYYKGIHLLKQTFGIKLGFIREFLLTGKSIKTSTSASASASFSKKFLLPVFFENSDNTTDNFIDLLQKTPYPVHHIQYRTLTQITPFYNVFLNKQNHLPWLSETPEITSNLFQFHVSLRDKCNFSLPQYRQNTTFKIQADIQNDIYHLYASSSQGQFAYYDVAYIPNYKTSVMMNNIFRKIKENRNLDYIEESDDEDDFQNIREDKYVDLQKSVFMECAFHTKFKRWVPVSENDIKGPLVPSAVVLLHKLLS